MEYIVSNAEIQETDAFKKLDKMFQMLVLKLASKKIISQVLISHRHSNVIPGSISGNNLKVLKSLIEKENK